MKRALLTVVAVLGVWACGRSAETSAAAANDADTLTRRQKDSIISEMPLPGAGGVGKAMRAVDQANEKVERHDTIR